jgi:hypothetical protein
MEEQRLRQEVDSAGWEADGSFSEHLVIGNKGAICLIFPSWVEGSKDPMYELHDLKGTSPTGYGRSHHPRKWRSYFGSTAVRPRKSGVSTTGVLDSRARGVQQDAALVMQRVAQGVL